MSRETDDRAPSSRALLEELVEAELARALRGVAHRRGRPAFEEASHPLLFHHQAEAARDGLEASRVNLPAAAAEHQHA
jgi:hypothetical protein